MSKPQNLLTRDGHEFSRLKIDKMRRCATEKNFLGFGKPSQSLRSR